MVISERQRKVSLKIHLENPCLLAHQKFPTQAWLWQSKLISWDMQEKGQSRNLIFAHAISLMEHLYPNLTSHLWNTFIQIYESATRIDIVFDLYILNSIKNDERDRRGPIAEQILPAEMDLFWALSENKIVFQQFFIEWCVKNHSNDKPIYLGGAHPDNIRLYEDYWTVSCATSFKCDHEKADDRMMFHCQPCYQSWKL